MRPEVATALLLTFLPALIIVLSYRDWQRVRGGEGAPPLTLVVSTGIVAVLLLTACWSATSP